MSGSKQKSNVTWGGTPGATVPSALVAASDRRARSPVRRDHEASATATATASATGPVDTRVRALPAWCTPEGVGALCELLRAGRDVRAACAQLGIARSSFYLAREQHAELDDAVEAALQYWEAERVDAIQGADDWKAQAWLLERRRPKKYAPPPKRIESTGRDGGPIQQSHTGVIHITDDETVRTIRIARAPKEST